MSTGPTGLAGAQGPQGPVGPRGATGPTGIAGPAGGQGVVGPVGPRGATGPLGLDADPMRIQTIYGTDIDSISGSAGTYLRTLGNYLPPLPTVIPDPKNPEIVVLDESSTIPGMRFLELGSPAINVISVPPGTYLVRAWTSTASSVGNSYIRLSSVTYSTSFTYTDLLLGTIANGSLTYINDIYTFAASTNVVLRQTISSVGDMSPDYIGTKVNVSFIKLR